MFPSTWMLQQNLLYIFFPSASVIHLKYYKNHFHLNVLNDYLFLVGKKKNKQIFLNFWKVGFLDPWVKKFNTFPT